MLSVLTKGSTAISEVSDRRYATASQGSSFHSPKVEAKAKAKAKSAATQETPAGDKKTQATEAQAETPANLSPAD